MTFKINLIQCIIPSKGFTHSESNYQDFGSNIPVSGFKKVTQILSLLINTRNLKQGCIQCLLLNEFKSWVEYLCL
jgi:hypothetical protein